MARVYIDDGPAAIKSENARLNGWIFIDIEDIDVSQYVENGQALLKDKLDLPPGYSVTWAGQYEYIERAKDKLNYVIPLTLAIIVLLLYLNFKRFAEVAIILGTLPLAMIGGVWLVYLADFNLSVAVGVGFIALAGVAVEIGVIMLVYLNQAYQGLTDSAQKEGERISIEALRDSVMQGAGLRVRPVMMTVATVIIGLLPVMYGSGTGSEVMSRIAAPMVGGMASALILSLLVVPAVYFLWRQHSLKNQ